MKKNLSEQPAKDAGEARLDRRRFVTGMGAAAGAAMLGAWPGARGSARAGEFTGKIRKAVKFHMVSGDASILDKFKLLKDLGFDGTEMRVGGKEDPAEVRAAIEKTGLPVHGVVNSSNPDITAAIEFSKSLGGSSVLFVCRYDKKISLKENWDRDQATIRKAIPAAEKHEVKVLVENVWASYMISAFDYERFIDEIDNPWVGSYFDVGNNVRWGVAEHWVKHLGSRIGKLDIKEFDDKKHQTEGLRAGFNTSLGEGSVDWAAVRRELAAIGYEGWATAEVKGGDRARLADIAQRMDKVLGL